MMYFVNVCLASILLCLTVAFAVVTYYGLKRFIKFMNK